MTHTHIHRDARASLFPKKRSFLLFLFTLLLVASAFFSADINSSFAAGTNLVSNPDVESSTTGTAPTGWLKGGYGTNTSVYSYPVTGFESSRAMRVSVSSYTSGDAKWYFPSVAVSGNTTYEYSDVYRSDVVSYVTVQFKLSDGSFSYTDIDRLDASADWQTFSGSFKTPPTATAVTVFHLIKSVGFLETDKFFLGTSTIAPTDPDPTGLEGPNLISNPGVESSTTGTAPTGWLKGGYGTNTSVYSYPVAGFESARALKVSISSYTLGDAKWYFQNVAVSPDTLYDFSDTYRSDAVSYVTVQFKLSDGSFSYLDIGRLDPSPTHWQTFKTTFKTPVNVTSATVFHLIKSVGYLETDTYFLGVSTTTISDPTKFDKGYVSIQFDDGVKQTYQTAYPMLDRAGFRSTAFIVTSRLKEDDFPGYVKAADVLAMQQNGHEIGAHTKTHANLTTLSGSDALLEIEGSRSELLSLGVKPVNYFAYPYGGYNATIKQMVKDAGYLGARSSDGGYNRKNQDRFALKRQPMVNTTTFEMAKRYIDTAIADRTWVVLLFHQVDSSGNTYAVTPQLFQQIIDYLKQKQVTPITMSEGFALMDQ